MFMVYWRQQNAYCYFYFCFCFYAVDIKLKKGYKPISRVLYVLLWAAASIIYLGYLLPSTSNDLPLDI